MIVRRVCETPSIDVSDSYGDAMEKNVPKETNNDGKVARRRIYSPACLGICGSQKKLIELVGTLIFCQVVKGDEHARLITKWLFTKGDYRFEDCGEDHILSYAIPKSNDNFSPTARQCTLYSYAINAAQSLRSRNVQHVLCVKSESL